MPNWLKTQSHPTAIDGEGTRPQIKEAGTAIILDLPDRSQTCSQAAIKGYMFYKNNHYHLVIFFIS